MMPIYKTIHDPDNPYLVINKCVTENQNLSAKAKWILCYLLGKTNNWKTRMSDIVNHTTDGVDAIRTGIEELEEAGYITREKLRGKDGTYEGWEYNVYEVPPTCDKTISDNPTLLSNEYNK